MLLEPRTIEKSSGYYERYQSDSVDNDSSSIAQTLSEDMENAIRVIEGMDHALSSYEGILDEIITHLFGYHKVPPELVEVISDIDELPEDLHKSSISANIVQSDTLEHSKQFIKKFFKVLKLYGYQWKKVHVSTEGMGEVSFEWWRGEKTLTFIIEPSGEVEYLKVWGPNIFDEMEEGENPTDLKLIDLWRWLNQ